MKRPLAKHGRKSRKSLRQKMQTILEIIGVFCGVLFLVSIIVLVLAFFQGASRGKQ